MLWTVSEVANLGSFHKHYRSPLNSSCEHPSCEISILHQFNSTMGIKFRNFEGQMCIESYLEEIEVLMVDGREESLLELKSFFRDTSALIGIRSRKGQLKS